ncbi:MAG: adenylate/guanylate cyclase domain-containing protein [Candidatus Binatia bacterium]
MTFDEVLDQVRVLLQQRGRVTYQSLKRRFELDDEYVEDLKGELIRAEGVAVDEDRDVLVWVGKEKGQETEQQRGKEAEQEQRASSDASPQTRAPRPTEGERRQLTVQFIDLVGSTTLSQQLDPEDYHACVVAYQTACRQVIARYEGHVAQYLGDGVLAYFGYPIAHEDDAARAVHSGLEIVTVVHQLAYTPPLQVRIGIHTGPVVVGEIGVGERTERLALGETPNIAARVQGQAEPNEVVISAATYHLVAGLFTCEARGQPALKGVATPLTLYQVVKESEAHSRFEVAVQAGLTPLVGRDLELGLLQERWTQAKEGAGQVVLLSGEPGIGKSRLVQELKNAVTQAGAVRIEYRCSSYHQNSALYPLVEHVQRVLYFTPGDTPQGKLRKLEQTLSRYHFPQNDTVPLLAALLSLPQAGGSPLLSLTPQQQKQKTLDVLVRWLLEEAERAPVYAVWEDLHWADPSTLEFLMVCLDQTPTARMLMVLTGRPEFTPTWASRSHISHLVLSRLGQQQSSAIVKGVTGGKTLPREVVQQIANKTDGVPLFVEELTKMVVESGLVREVGGRYELNGPLPPLAIPSTLQDSLMARLDRLASVRDIAQMGATIGREFTYELLRAVSPLNEETLQRGLKQLVEAELVYQSGLPPQARYLFKHALVQDTAYQSLLKSRRQQLHQRVAQVLEEQFPQTGETQPELVAYHYTEAGLGAHAIPYWQRAGERAVQRSANAEAITHLTKGLELLNTLPATPEHIQQELTLQLALGTPLMATKGYSAPEVGHVYARARELCQQLGDIPQLFPVLMGLWVFYTVGTDFQAAYELAEQCLRLADRVQDPGLQLEAHVALGPTLFYRGELTAALTHLEHGITLYDPQQHRSHAFVYGTDPGVPALGFAARSLGLLGYLVQARQRGNELLALTQGLSAHHNSLGAGLMHLTLLHLLLRDEHSARERAEALIALATEHELLLWLGMATMLQGAALVEESCWSRKQREVERGIAQLRQGLAPFRSTGAGLELSPCLVLLAKGYGEIGQPQEGLNVLAEALAIVNNGGERYYEAELYRLKGELTLTQSSIQSLELSVQKEAEECFWKAIEITRKQSAKLLELRAVMSLAKLWQRQGRQKEAHEMLAAVYNWFTEGFDTKDLQEAKVLLDELS